MNLDIKVVSEINNILVKWDPIGNIPDDKLIIEYISYSRELASILSRREASMDQIVDYIKMVASDIVGIDPEKNAKLKSDISSISEQIWKLKSSSDSI